tara:strand:+ start:359 stop:778 length:420 start_codon:yes stop_codon:yes gene_type:complete
MEDYNEEYEKVKSWAKSKGYYVSENNKNRDMVCFEERIIYINSRQSYENMLYAIIHESGHILTNNNIKYFLEKHPIYPYHITDGRVTKSKKYSVCLISEELEAWKRGLGLAKKLNIKIDKNNFFKIMIDSVWSYIDSIN